MERARRLFANRTLNLRAIEAIGYDLDYTLVHYHVARWEERAFAHVRERLIARGLPAHDVAFDPDLATVGLITDTALGNLVKADRFGFVKAAAHGTRMLGWEEVRATYARTTVDLREPRWSFLNTLFAAAGSCMYMGLVDRLDAGRISSTHGYADLSGFVDHALAETHVGSALKAEILADPERFVQFDADTAQALLDQKRAGKRLLLVTNNEVAYGTAMLRLAIEPYLPGGMTWRDLFDAAFFLARKPQFFSQDMPVFEVVDDTGLMRPHTGPVRPGGAYVGGSAALVEQSFGLEGESVLYVGDHIFTDVNVAKSAQRWRTCAIVRGIEDEVRALDAFADRQTLLDTLMVEKSEGDEARATLRLLRQRLSESGAPPDEIAAVEHEMDVLRARIEALDARIGPLAEAAGNLVHKRWGPVFRAGSDKSHLARQVERYADVYTSRVSNFLHATPFAYLRATKGNLHHDR